jgi:hypothetical protein
MFDDRIAEALSMKLGTLAMTIHVGWSTELKLPLLSPG